MERTIVFYHGGCPDGFGGAYAAWKKFGDAAEYIPLHRGEELIEGVEGAHLYFIDFTYAKEMMDAYRAKAARVVVLDHHVGVKDVVESMPEHVFDNDRSGATIAWSYFHPDEKVPELLRYVEDDDLFRFALPETRPVISYLSVHPFTFAFWDDLAATLESADSREQLLSKARAYAEYFELLAQLAVDKADLVTFEGHEVYFATAHPFKPMKSLVGNLLAKKHPPFALVVSAHPKGFGVSLRGDGSIDLTKIAVKFGGNGHHDSSGFVLPADAPLPWKKVETDEAARD